MTHRLPESGEIAAGAEQARLLECASAPDPVRAPWRAWGPFVAARAWGTVREDYSADGDAWTSFPHDHARSRTYRWSEDGLAAVCDRDQYLCLGLALWNGADPILKERAFGLTGPEGNHGEDVKECYWHVDATPTHSWLRWRYHYPQAEFPYDDLVAENARRDQSVPEYELLDTGVFDGNRFWIVEVTYAKAAADDLCVEIAVTNAGPEPAVLHVLPQLWFRNTWAWGQAGRDAVPSLTAGEGGTVAVRHEALGSMVLTHDPGLPADRVLFCDNETNAQRLYGEPGRSAYPKDGINDHVVSGAATVNTARTGTKAAVWHQLSVGPGETQRVRLRLAPGGDAGDLGSGFDAVLQAREREADEFWAGVRGVSALDDEGRYVARRALSGLLWSQQFYHYDVHTWLHGDPASISPPFARRWGRNGRWDHLDANDVIVMPDTWEYPWFAAWDLAFHTVALAHVDPSLAKAQLLLLEREWYQHPNGQLPAYEWAFDDVNPPVQAWAALRVFALDGRTDHEFLARIFHKLLINVTWWTNREDTLGGNIFTGGFLGLDNIGPIDRSHLPPGLSLAQADATAWMALYCLGMLNIAVVLAGQDSTYEDLAITFFERFALIADSVETSGLWDDQDGFYYDQVLDGTEQVPVRARSFVGLMPIVATAVLEERVVARLPEFSRRLEKFLSKRPDLSDCVDRVSREGARLLSIVSQERLPRLVSRIVDPGEFWSGHGVRSLSRAHVADPVRLQIDGMTAEADYDPGESSTRLYGGNSNWRGPVWIPANLLLVDGLRQHARFDDSPITLPPNAFGDGGDGQTPVRASLSEIISRLAADTTGLLRRGPDGRRPANSARSLLDQDPLWRDQLWLHEYFHGDTGAGLGAEHQTGWTACIADLLLRGIG